MLAHIDSAASPSPGRRIRGRTRQVAGGRQIEEGSGPRLIIDGAGRILWRDALAAREFDLREGAEVGDLGLLLHASRLEGRALAELAQAASSERRLLRAVGRSGTIFLVARPIHHAGGGAVLVEPVHAGWTKKVAAFIAREFGLTDAETEVAASLASGHSAARTATQRGVSIATVRSQIRSLLEKTGAAGQTDLVRLLVSLAHHSS